MHLVQLHCSGDTARIILKSKQPGRNFWSKPNTLFKDK
jgi:hypothetical protein